MPTPTLQTVAPQMPVRRAQAVYRVQSGDTLGAIAARTLGAASRWKELYDLNKGAIGDNPGRLRVGAALVLPVGVLPPTSKPAVGTTPVPKPPVNTTPVTPKPPSPKDDRDGDGVFDRYDASPDNARDRRWNRQATDEYASFVGTHTAALQKQGVEIDCADFAIKLLADFCAKTGLPNPLADKGDFKVYTPQRSGGLPNVQGPNYFFSGLGAHSLAKTQTKRVNDADGNGVSGFDRKTGQVDVADLRAGDILFYDWEQDGKVDHTVKVLGVKQDGTVTIGWGTYDNLAQDGRPVQWANLDLSPINMLELKPGTEDHARYLGPENGLSSVSRYTWMADKEKSASVPYVPFVRTENDELYAEPEQDFTGAVTPPRTGAPVVGQRTWNG